MAFNFKNLFSTKNKTIRSNTNILRLRLKSFMTKTVKSTMKGKKFIINRVSEINSKRKQIIKDINTPVPKFSK